MKKLCAFLLCGLGLFAHPMGNFSVNHYSKLQVTAHTVQLQYVLDLAEIPTFELLRSWQIDRSASPEEIHEHAATQARDWLSHLAILVNEHRAEAHLDAAKATIADGAGNLPILRIDMRAHVDASGGSLEYQDGNYPERAGWKEIVTVSGANILLTKVSQSSKDLSQALTHYPPDPTVAPPQDLHAELHWKVIAPARLAALKPGASPVPVAPPAVVSIPQPHVSPAAVAPATMTAAGAPAGAVVRGDRLSQLLHQKQLSLPMILFALVVAFGLGAVHALTPGHGKAIVAAYLVGARGTIKHAAFLGVMVTFTHTIMVFALGLATLFLFRLVVPEKITVLLGALSGLSIVAIGAFTLGKRLRSSHRHTVTPAPAHVHVHTHPDGTTHSHSHAPAHNHEHLHEHVHSHAHTHTHSHGVLGTHTHSHVPEELSWAGLVALGASGGLVPCESALLLLLGAIALGRIGLGLLLLVSFSLGLALVLMVIGILVLYAKRLLPERTRSSGHPFLRWVSIASPAIVMLVGLVMTAASLGLIQSKWMIG